MDRNGFNNHFTLTMKATAPDAPANIIRMVWFINSIPPFRLNHIRRLATGSLHLAPVVAKLRRHPGDKRLRARMVQLDVLFCSRALMHADRRGLKVGNRCLLRVVNLCGEVENLAVGLGVADEVGWVGFSWTRYIQTGLFVRDGSAAVDEGETAMAFVVINRIKRGDKFIVGQFQTKATRSAVNSAPVVTEPSISKHSIIE